MRRLFTFLSLLAGLIGAALVVPVAYAQVNTGLNEVGQVIKLPNSDPRVIAVNIINVALGLIGIVMVVLILYAGFLYMTSGGVEEKTTRAKKIITGAVVGLVIILSAWGITRFIIQSLLNATQDTGGQIVSGGGGGLGGGFGGGGGGAEAFRIKSITPSGSVALRNVEVKVVFTKSVDDTTASAIAISKVGGTTVGGTFDVSGSTVTFTPAQACPAPNQTRKCFDADTDYAIKVGSVRSTSGQTVTCGGFGASCEGAFHTGNLVDTQPPTISLSYPVDGQSVRASFLQDVQADASDDSGVGSVDFFDGSNAIGTDAPTASTTPKSFSAKVSWNTAGAALGIHTLSATANDLDTNSTKSANVSVVVRADHCFNGKVDAPMETGIDCGGDPNSADFCGACAGGSCVKNSDCSSGFCSNGTCVVKPVIETVSPLDGQPGTFVTIHGTNFGTTPGVVTFAGGKIATAPQACVDAGASTWNSSEVIVQVPDGAASGPIQLKNAASGLSDATNDANGPHIPDFLVNNVVHPGLCAVNPSSASVGTQVDAVGQGFGGSPQKIEFGANEISAPFNLWSETKINFQIPVVNSAPYPVTVKTATGESNPVTVTVVDKAAGATPHLDSIDPGEGPKQTYVTLFGTNFGYSVGTVKFIDANAQEAVGDTSFPDACSVGFWRDDRIVVKVPSVFKNNQPLGDGTYTVKIQRPDLKESNTINFKLNSQLPLQPGICAVIPAVGPAGTAVELVGDRFGNDKPSVTFYQSKLADVSSNANQSVKTSVPSGALTGPIQLVTSQKQSSNKVNFSVQNCQATPNACNPNTEQCCPTGECRLKSDTCGSKPLAAEYAWQTSTGLIPVAPRVIEECRPDLKPAPTPSPSPWLNRTGGDQAPVDSAIVMRFSTLLDPTTVNQNAFKLSACTAGGSDPCTKTTPVTFTISSTPENDTQQVVTLTPQNPLAPSTTYLVDVVSTVKSSGPAGMTMDPVASCGMGPNKETYGYCFRFKTSASTAQSSVGSVNVIPQSHTMHNTGETQAYASEPIASGDACIVLNCSNYNWTWFTGASLVNQDGRASITNLAQNGKGLCQQTATGLVETGNVPVDVNAELAQATPITGTGKLFVNFVPPTIEDYAPKCDQACVNAYIWARFSGELDKTSVTTPGNVVVQKCYNENCYESELSSPLPIGPDNIDLIPPFGSQGDVPRVIRINPSTQDQNGTNLLLEPGAFYRVLLKGGPNVANGIIGKNKVPITGLNNPQGFVWTFRAKQGTAAFCKAERVDVQPLQKFETALGASQLFTATPFGSADACSASGQALIPTTNASWTSSDPMVAALYTKNGSLIDTGAVLPAGCSGSCRATGATGIAGKVAVCGNNIIETTDGHYCKNGKTPKGDVCTLLPAGAKAGEECEPSIDGAACSLTTCLWVPVVAVGSGGTCGNGVVDVAAGEACDFGPTCLGGAATSSNPVADYTPCLDPSAKTACEQAGGKCAMHDYRGCSASCRHLGASAGKSTCGNSDPLGDGKDCDDGNQTDGDGCSAMCLHEGSQPATTLAAVCGNGILEPGETCERPDPKSPFPAGCNTITCLHTGSVACSGPNGAGCCGNGKIDAGEDCDDGNHVSGDGCSASCLLEGSSAAYVANNAPNPSFCGNGILEQGEQCEAGLSSAQFSKLVNYTSANPSLQNALGKGSGAGDKLIDPTQLAYIVGNGTPDAVTGRMSSNIKVNVENQDGQALYGLQCGFTDEASCAQFGAGLGLDDHGCCAPRPRVDTPYPPKNQTGVCRNVQIKAIFNTAMNSGVTVNNFEVSQLAANDVCPQGTQELLVERTYGNGFWDHVLKAWDTAVSWITGSPVYAEKWCKGAVSGKLEPVGSSNITTFVFTLDHALDANTTYRVRFLGDNSTSTNPLSDNADKSKRLGVKTARGVVHAFESTSTGELVWTFKTGTQVCAANIITIGDTTPTVPPDVAHPFLFTNPGNQPETRSFAATAQSLQNGQSVPLSPIAEYAWKWSPWASSDQTVVTVTSSQSVNTSSDQAAATSKNKNGTSILTAQLKITTDTVNVPSSTGRVVAGVAPVSVLICENPWPSLPALSPFRDAAPDGQIPSSFKPGDQFYDGPFYNFSTMYCRDALKPHDTTDDLPALNISQVPKTKLDDQNGILRQYLFSYPPETDQTPVQYRGLQKDGIGIRIVSNFQHLSPQEWYLSRGFHGSPQSITVDGYPAIQDGTTIYVAASSRPAGNSGKIYSNIYLISHNPDALDTTMQIYNQMVKYLTFNINITNQSNACVDASNFIYTNANVNGGAPVTCSTDRECVTIDAGLHCDSLKLKLTRDTERMADFVAIAKSLERAKSPAGQYPQAAAGTYLSHWSTSLWPSWASELGAALGATPPKDPVNAFLTCGRCESSLTPCQSNNDCPAVAGGKSNTCKGGAMKNNVWAFNANIDPVTCWNQTDHQYICPKLSDSNDNSVSRVYQYKSLVAGTRYDLGAEFEVPPTDPANWWSPPLPQGVFKCVTTSTYGQYCAGANGGGDDALCRPCPNAAAGQCKTCQSGPKKGAFCADSLADCGDANVACADTTPTVVGSCRQFGGTFTYSGICNNIPQGDKAICGDGVLYTDPVDPSKSETCEVGMTQQAACTAQGNVPGHKRQICDPGSCNKYIDDVQHPQCIADIQCGNGRIDKACNADPKSPCLTDSDCSANQTCQAVEKCDDGLLNGTYGHCSNTCQGYGGYCGDGKLSPGELCDEGQDNGKYGGACSSDCKGPGPSCGDGVVNGPEVCDGNTDATDKAICVAGKNTGSPCSKDADCDDNPVPNSCGGVWQPDQNTPSRSCVGFLVNGYQTQHTRTCAASPDPNACMAFGAWSLCQPKSTCGDGIVDPNEECDSGSNNGDTKACTSQCKKNVCGDGKVYQGVEDCDAGTQNGQPTCSAEYNSMCLSCSKSCKFQATAGGYCGDGVKSGPEQCDGNVPGGSSADCTMAPSLNAKFPGLCPILASPCTQDQCVQTKESGVTCESLGYDYSKNGSHPTLSGPAASPFAKGEEPWKDEPTCQLDDNFNWWERTIYRACFGMHCTGDAQNPVSVSSTLPSVSQFWDCARQVGSNYGIKVNTDAELVSCTPTCGFGNCVRCSDAPGTSVIQGRIFDALFQQVVPAARVSLLYKGVKVDEAFTDNDGYFKISTLNSHPECGAYKLIVDMYQDNICTGSKTRPKGGTAQNCYSGLTPPWTYPFDLDEGAQGGYFPYTSPTFQAGTYASVVGTEGTDEGNANVIHINIYPRPENGKGYAAVTWNHTAGNTDIYRHIHTIVPADKAFTVVSWDKGQHSQACTYPSPGCARDVQYQAPGDWNLGFAPYARDVCFHRAGEKTGGSATPAYNGCPIEGVTACLQNHRDAQGQLDNTGPNAETVATCKGQLFPSQVCSDCGADSSHYVNSQLACSLNADWESCWRVSYGPVASFFNWEALGTSDNVKLYFNGLYDSASAFTQALQNPKFGYKAYVAVGYLDGNAQLYTIEPPSGWLVFPGYSWHLGDIDTSGGGFNQKNEFAGVDTDVNFPPKKPTDGMACYRYQLQCGNGAYCVSANDTTKVLADPAIHMCYWPAEQSYCTSKPGYKCGLWDPATFNKYNW